MTKYCVERFQKFPTREKDVKLTIGLPVFNGERYLADFIKCILEQTFGEFTLIICDNASTDLTPEICQHYAQGDDRIQVFRNPR